MKGNDLDSIRALFSEKEKELSMAVAKVDVLTRQLEELRRDRRGPLALLQPGNSIATSKELENLRRELMVNIIYSLFSILIYGYWISIYMQYRNQLSLQQDAKLHLQREALQQRQAELHSVDQRILELQERLNRRKSSNLMLQRISNDQNDNTLLFYNNNNSNNQGFQLQNRTNNMKHLYHQKRGNVVAVEPYNHNPTKMSQNQEVMSIRNETSSINKMSVDDNSFVLKNTLYGAQKFGKSNQTDRKDRNESEAELKMDIFQYRAVSSNDQSIHDKLNKVVQMQGSRINKNEENLLPNMEDLDVSKRNKDEQNLNNIKTDSSISSSYRCAFDQEVSKKNMEETMSLDNVANEIHTTFKHRNTHVIPSGNLLTPPRKPISSVAPSSFTNSTNFSGSSPKVHIVSPSVTLISQISNIEKEKSRPALPPKPTKGGFPINTEDLKQESSYSENLGTFSLAISDANPIKAKPLTIKKQPVTEQPKLKSTIVKHTQTTFQQVDIQKQSQINGIIYKLDDNNPVFETNDETDKSSTANNLETVEKPEGFRRKRALANENMKIKLARRVSFDPLGN